MGAVAITDGQGKEGIVNPHRHTVAVFVVMHVDGAERISAAKAEASRLLAHVDGVVRVKALDADCGPTWLDDMHLEEAITKAEHLAIEAGE